MIVGALHTFLAMVAVGVAAVCLLAVLLFVGGAAIVIVGIFQQMIDEEQEVSRGGDA